MANTVRSLQVETFTNVHKRNVDSLKRYRSEVAQGRALLKALLTIPEINDKDRKAL